VLVVWEFAPRPIDSTKDLHSGNPEIKYVISNRRRRVRNLRLAGPARMSFRPQGGMTMAQKNLT